jgi:hypothetical protein
MDYFNVILLSFKIRVMIENARGRSFCVSMGPTMSPCHSQMMSSSLRKMWIGSFLPHKGTYCLDLSRCHHKVVWGFSSVAVVYTMTTGHSL